MARTFDPRELDATADQAGAETGSRAAVRLLGCAIAMLIVSFLVVTRSSSALVPQGTTAATEIRSGVLALSDDDAGRTLFELPALVPGQIETRCIEVTYTGDVRAVRVALRGDGGGQLASALDLTVEVGTGGSFDDCSSFRPDHEVVSTTLSEFLARHSPRRSGAEAFLATTGTTRSFRFRFTLDGARATQGATAAVDFLWTATPA